MGMPRMDVAAMLGSLISRDLVVYDGDWWIGMLWQFVNGTVIFPLVFGYLVAPRLSGEWWTRGLLFGLTLWLLSQILVSPILGMGVFSAAAPVRS